MFFHLASEDLYDLIAAELGEVSHATYKLLAMRGGAPIPIPRFLDVDSSGVLYIGKSSSFTERLGYLRKSILPAYQGSSHICGRRYKCTPRITEQFPPDTLYIQILPCDNPHDEEKRQLAVYQQRYGEVPPLNAIA
jgi:hypothetical protein